MHLVNLAAFALHIAGGTVGLGAGTMAALARKGGRVHRRAGQVFVAAMLVMGMSAIYLAVVRPDQLVNVFIGIFALYLVVTGWLAARRQAARAAAWVALGVSICLCVPFVVLAGQLALGLTPMLRSAVPLKGPVVVAIDGFTIVLLLAATGDARAALGKVAGAGRISRHLWRMCVGLTLAAGSGFTNGFARLLPGPYHVPAGFFLPQFLPLILLALWMVRVRVAGGGPGRDR